MEHLRVNQNQTMSGQWLQLEGFLLSRGDSYVALGCFLLLYVAVLAANVTVAVVIVSHHRLQTPMYLLFVQLTLNDIMGSSAVLPRVLIDLLRPPELRRMHLYECVLQAFFVHFSSTVSHAILMIMAFDRYVAICDPLRYSSIMSSRMLVKLTTLAWGATFVLIALLIGLTVKLTRCRSLITGVYCANASLFKLSCENTVLQNILGLVSTVLILTISIGSMLLTYVRITLVCVNSHNSSMNRRALQTCSTHLTVYLLLVVSGLSIVVLQRFTVMEEVRKVVALLKDLVPGSLNPIIYGLQSKEIRHSLLWCGSKCKTRKIALMKETGCSTICKRAKN